MFNYLSKFIPNYSKLTEVLRHLIKNEVDWQWSEIHSKALDELKTKVSQAPVLKIFDSKSEITIQCDASSHGLGACLIQNNQPVSFLSRSLTDCEKRYAQIEKELLEIVFGCEKLHNFIYGKKVKILTDHKPLLEVVKKDLNKVSARLQRMLLKLLKYNITLEYLPGPKMFVADTLSKFHISDKVIDDPDMKDVVHTVEKYFIGMEEQKEMIKKATVDDADLKKVTLYCELGWPKNVNRIEEAKLKYFYKIKE